MTYYQFKYKTKPNNRHDSRAYKHEVVRYFEDLDQIESDFLTVLFADSAYSYIEIFSYYNNKWVEHCEWITKQRKCKASIPNKDYFSNIYKAD